MDKEIIIREAELSDYMEVARLANQMGGGSHSVDEKEIRNRLGQFIEAKNEVVYLAEKDGRIYGLVSVYVNPELMTGTQARIDIIVVDEASRGMGVGKLLMRKAEEWAKRQGSETMKLNSNVIRVDSHKFYENIGYIKMKEQAQFSIDL